MVVLNSHCPENTTTVSTVGQIEPRNWLINCDVVLQCTVWVVILPPHLCFFFQISLTYLVTFFSDHRINLTGPEKLLCFWPFCCVKPHACLWLVFDYLQMYFI